MTRELGTELDYLNLTLNLTHGNRYFVGVVAVVGLHNSADADSFATSDEVRYYYK